MVTYNLRSPLCGQSDPLTAAQTEDGISSTEQQQQQHSLHSSFTEQANATGSTASTTTVGSLVENLPPLHPQNGASMSLL